MTGDGGRAEPKWADPGGIVLWQRSGTAPAAGVASGQNGPMKPGEVSRLLAAEGLSNFGSMLSRLAIPWLATLSLQATPWQMAGLLLADVAAGAFSALWLGPWVDRASPRRVMLQADAARALLLAGLASLAWLGWASLPWLMAAAALQGVFGMAFELARSAWMARQLPQADLPRRNAQLSMVSSLSETGAFALGGWLYQGLGAVGALLLDAASYLASATCLKGLASPAPAAPAQVPAHVSAHLPAHVPAWPGHRQRLAAWWRDSLAGWQAIASQPGLRALAGIEALLAAALALGGTSYMIFVSRDLALPTGPLGLVFALGGLGAALGAALAPRWGRRWGPGRTMTLGLAAWSIGAACVPLAPASAGLAGLALATLVAHQIMGDAGHALHDVHSRSWRQTAVPEALLARVDAALRSLAQFATLAGALMGGALGSAWGTRSVLWLSAACGLGATVWGLASLGRLRPAAP